MSARTATRLAWGLCALGVGLAAVGLVLQFLTHATPVTGVFGLRGITTVPAIAFSFLGVLLATRRRENPIGWIFLAAGLVASAQRVALEYAVYDSISGRAAVPIPEIAAWVSEWVWVSIIGSVAIFAVLLFPDGRAPSPAWRAVGWTGAAGIALFSFGTAIVPGPMQSGAGIVNPFGIERAPWVADLAVGAGTVLFCGSIFAAAASLVVRFRRAGSAERAQIKWLLFAAGLLAAVNAVGGVVFSSSPPDSLPYHLFANLTIVFLAGIPVAVTVAILRHRLYDIDFIVNRTLAYGALTLVLALVYFGGVAGLQRLLAPLVVESSQLAVVASTLAIAALFSPFRRAIQNFIDRRFYREKYDARRVLETFSKRLRGETDLDRLGEEMVSVARETVQPTHASLWLRKPERGKVAE
jgi:hypothetical protein